MFQFILKSGFVFSARPVQETRKDFFQYLFWPVYIQLCNYLHHSEWITLGTGQFMCVAKNFVFLCLKNQLRAICSIIKCPTF